MESILLPHQLNSMRNDIGKNGFLIRTVIIDGRRGLYGLFKDVPIPDVAFAVDHHYTLPTKNPKVETTIKLKRITSFLGKVSQISEQS